MRIIVRFRNGQTIEPSGDIDDYDRLIDDFRHRLRHHRKHRVVVGFDPVEFELWQVDSITITH